MPDPTPDEAPQETADAALSRRSLLHGGALAVAAGIAGYVVARTTDATRPKSPTSGTNGYGADLNAGGRLLAALSQVPPGGGIILASDAIVLVRGEGDDVHGLSAICTHQGCTVNAIVHGVISCPCHGSSFSAQNGAVLTGPATRPLPAIPVVVRDAAVYSA